MYACIHMYICIYVCRRVYVYVSQYIYIYIHTDVHVHICIYIYQCVYMCVYIYIYIYIFSQVQTRSCGLAGYALPIVKERSIQGFRKTAYNTMADKRFPMICSKVRPGLAQCTLNPWYNLTPLPDQHQHLRWCSVEQKYVGPGIQDVGPRCLRFEAQIVYD